MLILEIETDDLDLGTIAGNTALLDRLREATQRIPLSALRATLASQTATKPSQWRHASRGRCVHSLMTICQKRAGVANNVGWPRP